MAKKVTKVTKVKGFPGPGAAMIGYRLAEQSIKHAVESPKPVMNAITVVAWKPEGMTMKNFKKLISAENKRIRGAAKDLHAFGIRTSIDSFTE